MNNKKLLYGLFALGMISYTLSNGAWASSQDLTVCSENNNSIPMLINDTDIPADISKQCNTTIHSFTICGLKTELVPEPITVGSPAFIAPLYFKNPFEYDGKMYAELIPKNGTFNNISGLNIYLDGIPNTASVPYTIQEITLYTDERGTTGKTYIYEIPASSEYAPMIKYRYLGKCKERVEVPKIVVEHRKLEFDIVTTVETN